MLAGAYIRYYELKPAHCQPDTNMPIIICVIIKQSLALQRPLSYPVPTMEYDENACGAGGIRQHNLLLEFCIRNYILQFSLRMPAWWWWTNFTIAAVLLMNELGREKVVVFVPDVVGELSQGEHPSSQHLFMISLILLNLFLLRTIAPSNHQAITIRI